MDRLQRLCFEGQNHLLATDYLAAERALVEAETLALDARDWDSLSRLYMPLQETRRQRRQRCGEGSVVMDLIAHTAADVIDPRQVLDQYPRGQLLVAGFGTLAPATRVRRLAAEQGLYVDVFLGASYWVNGQVVVAIVPTEDVAVPEEGEYSIDELSHRLPPHSLIKAVNELPKGARRGDTHTFAETMAMFESLHLPFLAMADTTTDLEARIDAYRRTIGVDYACELAHQRLSDTARQLSRGRK